MANTLLVLRANCALEFIVWIPVLTILYDVYQAGSYIQELIHTLLSAAYQKSQVASQPSFTTNV